MFLIFIFFKYIKYQTPNIEFRVLRVPQDFTVSKHTHSHTCIYMHINIKWKFFCLNRILIDYNRFNLILIDREKKFLILN